MEIIKDNMPDAWESKIGSIGYKFGCSYGDPVISGAKILLPIRPMFVFDVDKKEAGRFVCEEIAEITLAIKKEQVYQSTYSKTLQILIRFDSFARTKFVIPIKFQPPTYVAMKDEIINSLSSVSFPNSN